MKHKTIFLAIFILSLSTGFWSLTSQAEEVPSITITGEGMTASIPTKARIQGAVVTEGKTPEEALISNNQSMAKIFDILLKDFKIKREDIQTSSFQVKPKYQYNNNTRENKLVRYDVSNNIAVLIRELDQIGNVISKLVGAGMNNLTGPTFLVENSKELIDKARKMAMENAIEKAEIYAVASSGLLKLGQIIDVREGGGYRQGNDYSNPELGGADEGGDVPIASGRVTFQVSITVVFAINEDEQLPILPRPQN